MTNHGLKSRTTHAQVPLMKSHRWSADLRERQRRIEESKNDVKQTEEFLFTYRRHQDFIELGKNILGCRTSAGKVGPAYLSLRRRLEIWEAQYGTMTACEWECIQRMFFAHNIYHLL